MQLPITDSWRKRLVAIREDQWPNWAHYMQPVEEAMGVEVILVQYGLGCAAFLGHDGHGYHWNAAEDMDPGRLDNPRAMARLVVWAAKALEMWELTKLLPTARDDQVTCPMCEGERWTDLPGEWPGGYVCLACCGFGWMDKSKVRQNGDQER